MKNMTTALTVFIMYFILVAFLNAWFNNYETVDYFFLSGDKLTDIFKFLKKIKEGYIYELPVGNLTFKFYYLYQIIDKYTKNVSFFINPIPKYAIFASVLAEYQ
jgi:hypothetical protein